MHSQHCLHIRRVATVNTLVLRNLLMPALVKVHLGQVVSGVVTLEALVHKRRGLEYRIKEYYTIKGLKKGINNINDLNDKNTINH